MMFAIDTAIVADFFHEEVIDVPRLKYEAVPVDEVDSFGCVHRDTSFMRKQIYGRLESERYTLRILCRTSTNLDRAKALVDAFTREHPRMNLRRQKDLLSRLADLCEHELGEVIEEVNSDPNNLSVPLTHQRSRSLNENAPPTPNRRIFPRTPSVPPDAEGRYPQDHQPRNPFRLTDEAHQCLDFNEGDRRERINKTVLDGIKWPIESPYSAGKSGCIAIIESPSHPGWVKLWFREGPELKRRVAAMYSNDPTQYLEECLEDCQIVAYSSLLPNMRRVGGLIMAELSFQARDRVCNICPDRKHGWWFRADRELVSKLIMRWAKWMASAPYREDGSLSPVWGDRTRLVSRRDCEPGTYTLDASNTWEHFTNLRRRDPRTHLSWNEEDIVIITLRHPDRQ